MDNEKIIVLVPNYNGAEFIENTINSIINGFKEILIIVVDDLSTDNSIDVIEKICNSKVKLIKRNENGGFAAAVNTGIKFCIENDFNFLIVANSDIILTGSNCTDIYLEFLKFENNKVAVLGYLEDGLEVNRVNENISGFFFALRLSVVKSVGYLDETFYMYGEEQDFFRRIIDSGFKILQTGIKIRHLAEKSSSSNIQNSWLSIRNSIYLETKQKAIWPIIRKIIVLLLIINRIYRPKVKNDPSLERIYRPGILRGNLFLLQAIGWNIFKKLGVIKNAK